MVLTAGETLVSPTHLEFSYTQGPVKLKSLGHVHVSARRFARAISSPSAVNFFIQNPDGSVKLQGASYFMFFVWVMLGTGVALCHRDAILQGPNLFCRTRPKPRLRRRLQAGFAVQPEA